MERNGAFDYILLETTGLADPGNIAPVFWVDEGLCSTIYLDGIVTMVDAKNLLKSLEEPEGEEAVRDHEEEEHEHDHNNSPLLSIAHLQISHADVILINKADLVTASELATVEARVRSINSLARIQITEQSRVPQLEGLILDLHAYDRVSAENLDFAEKGHSHLDAAIGTVTVRFAEALSEAGMVKLDAWLRSVLWESKLPGFDSVEGWEIHRSKGRVRLEGGEVKMLQGVREIFELIDGVGAAAAGDGDGDEGEEEKGSRIVFIGRNLGGETSGAFQRSLDDALREG
jgi:G3E family GTPase